MSGTFTVTNISQIFSTSFSKHKVDNSRKVLSRHVFLIEIPIISRFTVFLYMCVRVLRAPIISKPNVIAEVGQNKCGCNFRQIRNIFHHVTVLSMHKQNNGLVGGFWLIKLARNAADSKNVAILSYSSITL